MRLVTFLLQEVPHYRIEFFDRLQARLRRSDIDIHVLYGCDQSRTAGHGGVIVRQWAEVVPTLANRVVGVDLVWQFCGNKLAAAELIIVEQSNRLLINYLLQIRRCWSRGKLAYWGHGRNMQSQDANGLRERWKRTWLNKVDWWFAYTDQTRQYLLEHGVSNERLTVVNNSLDGGLFLTGHQDCRCQSRMRLARKLDCADDAKIAIYCGQLHRHKHLEFLLQAATCVREMVSGFELLIIGDGPERKRVEAAARQYSWIHYVGSLFGAERAEYMRAAQLVMMPGAVGLVIIDSFLAACPLVTTYQRTHGPEIAYLESGKNGLMTDNDLEVYAQSVALLLQDSEALERLRQGCRVSGQQYSLDNMVEHFASGVEQCLGQARTAAIV